MRRHSKFQVKEGDRFKGILKPLELEVQVSEGIYSVVGYEGDRELPKHIFDSPYDADLLFYTLLISKNTIRRV